MQNVQDQIDRLAKVDATVLIEGGTGVDRDLAARTIHDLSQRRGHAFVPVNSGAFTDSKVASLELMHKADGGTVFLDEVDALNLKSQGALLRFLQDGSYRRVGDSTQRHADVRIIVGSNASLYELTEQRLFRKDLLYRINVLPLRLP
jgi:DNA-binding NtrC family response regulator